MSARSITVIGKGNMGTAIAKLASTAGRDVQQVDQSTAGATITGEVVVLAVPYGAVTDVIATYGSQLAGRVVVDITNPVDLTTFDSLVVPADSSATAQIAASLPASSVVKAFNTNFAATLASGTVGDVTTTVLVAGDDAAAKAAVVDLVTAAGLRGVDAGSLSRARELEALGFLQLTLAAGERTSWTSGFALLP